MLKSQLPPLSLLRVSPTFMSFLTSASSKRRPINRLASKTVFRGFMADWFLAARH